MAFLPCFTLNSRILILGSFPSVMSRAQNFYYGNPRNRFWLTLAKIFGEDTPSSIEDKKSFLARHGIALWDVVKSCRTDSSLDKDITDYVVQDIPSLVDKLNIRLIVLNGSTASRLFKRHFPQYRNTVTLPSTSPANTRFDFGAWSEAFAPFL